MLALSFLGLTLIAGVVGVVLFNMLGPMLKERILGEAKARGIELGFDDVEVSWSHLSIERARFGLVGVKGVSGTVQRIDISTSGFEPTGILLDTLAIELVGSLPSVAHEVTEWRKQYPKALELPLQAQPVAARWRSNEDQTPWLDVKGGKVGLTLETGAFESRRATLAGVLLGPIATSWSKQSAKVSFGFAEEGRDQTPVSLELARAQDKPTATIKLEPTLATRLAAALGVELPLEDVTVSSEATLQLQSKYGSGAITGSVKLLLDGYIPPHPRELDGFVFGKATSVASDFSINEDRDQVELTNSHVAAGSFKLKGQGQIQRYADHARARLSLTGFLRCADLAGAALETHLGNALSKLPKLLAKQSLQGTVGVTVKVDADTRDLQGATVLRQIGIGCGLKPLRPPTPEELEAFAKELPGFVEELPSLAKKLPLPAGVPAGSVFKPPPFALPKIEITPPKPKSSSKQKAQSE